jgi:hypothetical protein
MLRLRAALGTAHAVTTRKSDAARSEALGYDELLFALRTRIASSMASAHAAAGVCPALILRLALPFTLACSLGYLDNQTDAPIAAIGGAGGATASSSGGANSASGGGSSSATSASGGGGGSGGTPECTGAGTFTEPRSGHCYWASEAALSWDQALTSCLGRGSGWDLAAIGSKAEREFVFMTLMGSADVWIGGTDVGQEPNTFVWSNGERWVYAEWVGDNPSNTPSTFGTTQDCVDMQLGPIDVGFIDDDYCSNPELYLCERP